MDSHVTDQSASAPEEIPIQSKEADAILPPITPKDGSLDESHCKPVLTPDKPLFAPVDIGVLYEEEEEDVPWVLEGYLAEGGWTLLAGPPKLGKTTLAYDAIVAIATGRSFLGREVVKKKVLLLGVEEHRRDIIARLRQCGGDEISGMVKLEFPPLPYDNSILSRLHSYIMQEEISLVVVDTLHASWHIQDENDASQVNLYGHLLLQVIRSTKAAWLSLVHTRKRGGSGGEEIRGSSALPGLVDIAISIKGTSGGSHQRSLETISRYSDTPKTLIAYRDAQGYQVLGTPEELSAEAKAQKVWSVLTTDKDQSMEELRKATTLSKQAVSIGLSTLNGEVHRSGLGVKGTPFRYRRNSIHPTSNSIPETVDELNKPSEPLKGE
jgi:predicted ATP-dependent serine protease